MTSDPTTTRLTLRRYLEAALSVGCPYDQVLNLVRAGIVLQPRQLAASAAARLCDAPGGPSEIGFGGARGGGKSHWLLAQMGADDCQRVPGLKCLLLRKVGKANLEHFEDLRRTVLSGLPHDFARYRGILTFPNGSRIVAGHFQTEADIDAYLGLEYDVIGVEEATTLSHRKYEHVTTCCRSSKRMPGRDGSPSRPNSQRSTLNSQLTHWRPRIYTNTNPGGIGHAWYRARFIAPYVNNKETETRFIKSLCSDNSFNNPEYRRVLEKLTGWQRRAWLDGDWDIAAGQYFTTFRWNSHVICDPPAFRDSGSTALNSQPSTFDLPARSVQKTLNSQLSTLDPLARSSQQTLSSQLSTLDPLARSAQQTLNSQPSTLNYPWDPRRATEWLLSLDYGFTHYTVVLLGCRDGDGNIIVVDEHAERLWLPQRHMASVNNMLTRHGLRIQDIRRCVAGADIFARESDGKTIAAQYKALGLPLRPANTQRVFGWAEILARLGDPAENIPPRLFIHQRCRRLLETLPYLQHDPSRPEDVLKVDASEDGAGGDDAADALRYLVTAAPQRVGFAIA